MNLPPVGAELVSIGVPVFNGAAFIADALSALQRQTYQHLEIFISDNASDDSTGSICEAMAAEDRRIEYVRQTKNIGASQNFNFVFRSTSGPYFMWAAHDDMWHPKYIESCLELLLSDPKAVLAGSSVRFLSPSGTCKDLPLQADNPELLSDDPARRLSGLLTRHGWRSIYGLMRRSALQQTQLFRPCYGPDVVLLAELAMLGRFRNVPQKLFFYRRYDDRTEEDRASSVAPDVRVSHMDLAMTILKAAHEHARGWRPLLFGAVTVLLGSGSWNRKFVRQYRSAATAHWQRRRWFRWVGTIAVYGFFRLYSGVRRRLPYATQLR